MMQDCERLQFDNQRETICQVITRPTVEPDAIAVLAGDARKPSCLISCSHRAPEGEASAFSTEPLSGFDGGAQRLSPSIYGALRSALSSRISGNHPARPELGESPEKIRRRDEFGIDKGAINIGA
jgi:hypothetical protein